MMRKRANFKGNIIKSCAVCEYGRRSFDDRLILCEKQGIMSLDDICGRFCYDPLKRVPGSVDLPGDYSADDFKL